MTMGIARMTGAMCFAVFALYCWEVASRARLEAPAATPILYDRHGAYLTQIGHDGAGAAAHSRTRGANAAVPVGHIN